ncbi:hypothetical protein [Alienimonas chondri]|uniref:Prepilin-type N-terminal cleavage/methylation domain-containing protein n=1 Tax=Alienimonas chondri TaxID=2681879 RepID=A0ABX1VBI4_9PLAN|nr:hypothetical protein [Alienimonas chondri]NNJ25464.1 hypothetical protein [Alienimonas chondri]
MKRIPTRIGAPTPPRSIRRRAGYSLVELMVVISGTVALISVGASTIVAVRRVATTAHTAAEAGTALSRLHRSLREDAADAVAATADETGLTLTAADGAAIRYEADAASVRRTVTGPRVGRDRYPVEGTGFTWTAEPGSDGVRAAIGYDRVGGSDARSDGIAVELAAWLSSDERGAE